MAVKTITINMEAYNRLKRLKGKGESFSRTINRVVPEPMDVDEFIRRASKFRMSEEAAQAIEEHMRQRHKPSTRVR